MVKRSFLISFFVVLILLGVVSFFLVKGYIHSPAFTDHLEKLGKRELSEDFSLSPVKPVGWGFETEEITLREAGKIKALQIKNFRTQFGKWALLKRTWQMKRIECDELTVHIQRKRKKEGAQVISEKPVVMKSNTFLAPLLPDKIQFDDIQVKRCTGSVERKRRDVEWEDISLEGAFQEETLAVELLGGRVRAPMKILSDWELRTAQVEVTEDTFSIQDGQFYRIDGGDLRINGGGDFEGDVLDMTADFEGVAVQSLWNSPSPYFELDGVLDGEVQAFNEGGETVVKGTVEVKEGRVALPALLKPMAKVLGVSGKELVFTDFRGEVRHVDDYTVIDNLLLRTQELIQLAGRVELQDDRYVTNCQLGLPEGLYKRLPRRLQESYTPQGEVYWTPVVLDGEADDFGKEISLRLASQFGGAFLDDSDILNQIGKKVSDILGKDGNLIPEEKADELLEKGLKALKGLFK